ncbi:MFS general substrate transporter [Dentipellis sp. KUC8613]|nr:MFS general substrate transporter [Dentipellis sp. KUC8613]
MNAMSHVTFLIIVPSDNEYAAYLGGSATFSGLVIGIPAVFAGLALIPLNKIDRGAYKLPLHFSCATAILGNVLYGLAYRAHFLYLILIGRIVLGLAFTNFGYTKRFCSDARIVGVRRRTTVAGGLVAGQGVGFSVGPFVGGLLFKIGFRNRVFNGYTSPAWVMAVCWLTYWVVFTKVFVDVPKTPRQAIRSPVELESSVAPVAATGVQVEDKQVVETKQHVKIKQANAVEPTAPPEIAPIPAPAPPPISLRQWGVFVTMCWFAMTVWFVLGAWGSNIPVYTAHAWGWSPFGAGNLLALGGITTFPLLGVNIWYARRTQDRNILVLGCTLALAGLLLSAGLFAHGDPAHWGAFFACWFLTSLGVNIVSTVTMSLLSKHLPPRWNRKTSIAIQYSNFGGRVCGAVWGGAGVKVGMLNYIGLQIGLLGVGIVLTGVLWRDLKARKG